MTERGWAREGENGEGGDWRGREFRGRGGTAEVRGQKEE